MILKLDLPIYGHSIPIYLGRIEYLSIMFLNFLPKDLHLFWLSHN